MKWKELPLVMFQFITLFNSQNTLAKQNNSSESSEESISADHTNSELKESIDDLIKSVFVNP